MKRIFHLTYWPCLAALFLILFWQTRSIVNYEERRAIEELQLRQEEQIRFSLWRMDAFLTQYLLRLNSISPEEFHTLLPEQDRYEYILSFYEKAAPIHIGGKIPTQAQHLFQEYEQKQYQHGSQAPESSPGLIVKTGSDFLSRNTSIFADQDEFTKPETTKNTILTRKNDADFGVWVLSSQQVGRPNISYLSPEKTSKGEITNSLSCTAFAPFWSDSELFLARQVEFTWLDVRQTIKVDWEGLSSSVLHSVRDILPHARLQPYTNPSIHTKDVRRLLAGLPVILDTGDMPGSHAAIPLKTSLILVWVMASLAATGLTLLLLGLLKLHERKALFVSAVTHELRTPLTGLTFYSELLLHEFVTSDQYRECFAAIRTQTERLARMVDNVLNFSRIEQGSPGEKTVMPAQAVYDHIISLLEPLLELNGYSLQSQISPTASNLMVIVNRDHLEQIMINLADNTIKYAIDSNRIVSLLITSGEEGKLEINFRDYGPGIPSQQVKNIFKPFRRIPNSQQHKSGIGLGLSLSRKMARKMGGDLIYDKAFTKGSSFLLTLIIQTAKNQ